MKNKLLILFTLLVFFHYGQTRFNRVRQNINTDNAIQLITLLDSCLFKDYHRDSALFFKGLVHLKLNKVIEARRYYGLLVEEFPEFYAAHYLNGLIMYVLKRYGESIIELSMVIKKNPNDWRAHYDRALAYGQIDANIAVIEDLDACLKVYPNFASALYSRAYWNENSGFYKEAIRDYEKCIAVEPKNFDAYTGLAFAYQSIKDNDKACETINKAIKQGSQAAAEVKNIFCKERGK